MLTSTRFGVSYPNPATRADRADVATDLAAVVAGLENSVYWKGQGTFAARPAFGKQGSIYFATDQSKIYYDTGSAWVDVIAAASIGAGSVTTAMLASSVPIIPVGGMIDWPWRAADIPSWSGLPVGQSLTQAAYAALYALASAAGYLYGGSGPNFNLPDLRSRVTAGADDMGGAAAGRTTIAVNGTAGGLGATAGAEGVVLTTAQIPAHNHPVLPAGVAGLVGGGGFGSGSSGNSVPAISTGNTGGDGAHSSMQPTLFINKIMRLA